MERLTKHWGNNYVAKKLDYEYLLYMPHEQFDQFQDIIEKLAYYEDLEEQGKLLVLPCKVGEAVYLIEDYEIWKYKSPYEYMEIRKENGEYIFCIDSMDFRKEDFGKTVFLTKAEAEKALEEMEKQRCLN